MNFAALDRADIAFAVKECARQMAHPTSATELAVVWHATLRNTLGASIDMTGRRCQQVCGLTLTATGRVVRKPADRHPEVQCF